MGFHFFLTGLKAAVELDWDTLLEEVKQLAHPWSERLVQAIHEKFEAADAATIERKYRDAFQVDTEARHRSPEQFRISSS